MCMPHRPSVLASFAPLLLHYAQGHHPSKAAACTSEALLAKAEPDRCCLQKEMMLPGEAARADPPLAYLHIDCDLYAGSKDAFTLLSHKIVPGTARTPAPLRPAAASSS